MANNWSDTRLMTAKMVADRLGISRMRVYELVRVGLLPCVHIGRTLRFDGNAVQEWIARGGQALPCGWQNNGQIEK